MIQVEQKQVNGAGSTDLRATLKTRRGTVAPLEIEFTGTGTSSAPGLDAAEFTLRGPS
jgi:hypothetical protein